MNANKFAAVCTIIETKFIFYLSDIEEELNPKFHDECLLAKLMRSINKMKSIAIVVGGALINATAFVDGSYLADYFSGDQNSVEEEKKRRDPMVEKYQAAYESRKSNKAPRLDYQMAKSRSKKKRIWWEQIML